MELSGPQSNALTTWPPVTSTMSELAMTAQMDRAKMLQACRGVVKNAQDTLEPQPLLTLTYSSVS